MKTNDYDRLHEDDDKNEDGCGIRRLWRSIQLGLAVSMLIGAALAQEAGSRIDLTILGGPHAGSYAIASSLGCDFQDYLDGTDGEPPAFLGNFAADTRPQSQSGSKRNQLGRVTLIIPNVKALREDVFSLGVTFGNPNDRQQRGTFYEIYTVPLEMRSELELAVDGEKATTGRGRVSVDRSARSATIRFAGETAEAIRIEGVIQCNAFVS